MDYDWFCRWSLFVEDPVWTYHLYRGYSGTDRNAMWLSVVVTLCQLVSFVSLCHCCWLIVCDRAWHHSLACIPLMVWSVTSWWPVWRPPTRQPPAARSSSSWSSSTPPPWLMQLLPKYTRRVGAFCLLLRTALFLCSMDNRPFPLPPCTLSGVL